MDELARNTEKKKHTYVDRIEYDAAELEFQKQQLTAAAEEHKRKLDAWAVKLELAAERQKLADAAAAKECKRKLDTATDRLRTDTEIQKKH